MRLFISLDFDAKTKDALSAYADFLKKHAEAGNIVKTENLHATMVFLGEVEPEKVDSVKEALQALSVPSLTLTLEEIGTFNPRRPGKTYWVGIREHSLLSALHRRLKDELEQRGFALDARLFKPHITLGRKVKLDKTLHDVLRRKFSPFETKAVSLSLMLSEFGSNGVQYTPLYVRTTHE